jgi:hypothetical protein
VLELEDHVHLGPRRIGEQAGLLHGDAGHLADGQEGAVPPGEDLAVHLLQELVDPGTAEEGRGPVAER